ncbi:hypothetical protein OIU74_015635 [Salix koriyanagi]|uniref:Uncharacterized protein n=1 Tax=Salix koriyanagi TaxID=2511006 RepID=A0A9Q0SUY5_9ROSI|nr:hypothetical protein OIU74_015635 [Salix koriyanagi]
MLDQLPNRMHVSMPSSEMQGKPLLDVDLSTWVDSLILPMPDALETGLETEPADQPFEMDMNNIPSSLMRDVEFSRGKEKMTWELMPYVAIEQEEQPCLDEATPDVQRAAFDQLPNRMHGSMPSSEMQGQPLLDDELLWLNSLMQQEILLTDENVAPGMLMPDAPETELGTEPADQPFEMDMNNISSSLMQSVAIEQEEQPRSDDGQGGMDILIGGETELVEQPRAAVKYNVSGI